MQQKHIISCDWGTSSLRVQLIDITTQKCLAKANSNNGNAVIYNEWKFQPGADRVQFYLKFLRPLIIELAESSGVQLDDVHILISGMASSSVGMLELPYANVPFDLNGSSACIESIKERSIITNPVLLISGVQQSDDVMRGEETQLIGIASLIDLSQNDNHVFILPGTHSKHITVSNNSITHFKTFMTGEIFETLTRHTVLSHAVAKAEKQSISGDELKIFRQGVTRSLTTELLNSLFSVRINHLKNNVTPEQNYYYLSGLLIGNELKYMRENLKENLVLCSSGSLLQLYQSAIDCAGLSGRTTIVAAEILDKAAAAGQVKILKNIKS